MSLVETELINNPFYILSLLQRAAKTRAVTSLQRPHDISLYNSLILDVDPESKSLLLDSPSGDDIPLAIRPGEWMRFNIKLQGVGISFESPFITCKELDPLAYVFQLPVQLYYEQRRGNFRASIGYQFKTRFSGRTKDGIEISGRITDISLNGINIELDETISPDQLLQDMTIHNCQLHIDKESMRCDAKVRVVQTPAKGISHYRLGLELLNLSASDKRWMQRRVMMFDRENRKSALPD